MAKRYFYHTGSWFTIRAASMLAAASVVPTSSGFGETALVGPIEIFHRALGAFVEQALHGGGGFRENAG